MRLGCFCRARLPNSWAELGLARRTNVEISHRVKNSLQLVASMFSLQATAMQNAGLAPNLADVCHDLAELAPHCEINYLLDGSMSIATDRAVHDVNLVISSLKSMRTRPKSPNVATHW
jgi:two-component sensor histidine kinase